MMVGSRRIMLDSTLGEQAAASFAVRDVAPDILLFGNIGLSQLSKAAVPDIARAPTGLERMTLRCIRIRCRRQYNTTVTLTSPALLPGCVT